MWARTKRSSCGLGRRPRPISPAALRAQETAAVAAHGQQVLGGLAEVVLRVRVRHAVADAFVVGRRDMGDAVGGAIDLHAAGAGLRGSRTADQHGSGDDGQGTGFGSWGHFALCAAGSHDAQEIIVAILSAARNRDSREVALQPGCDPGPDDARFCRRCARRCAGGRGPARPSLRRGRCAASRARAGRCRARSSTGGTRSAPARPRGRTGRARSSAGRHPRARR